MRRLANRFPKQTIIIHSQKNLNSNQNNRLTLSKICLSKKPNKLTAFSNPQIYSQQSKRNFSPFRKVTNENKNENEDTSKLTAVNFYHKKVEYGEIKFDEKQEKLAIALDDILDKLLQEHYTLENFKQNQNDKNNDQNNIKDVLPRAGKRIKGAYIHGQIGCGKTMMLNIFHELCVKKRIPCKRVHFHEFILDVHLQLFRFFFNFVFLNLQN